MVENEIIRIENQYKQYQDQLFELEPYQNNPVLLRFYKKEIKNIYQKLMIGCFMDKIYNFDFYLKKADKEIRKYHFISQMDSELYIKAFSVACCYFNLMDLIYYYFSTKEFEELREYAKVHRKELTDMFQKNKHFNFHMKNEPESKFIERANKYLPYVDNFVGMIIQDTENFEENGHLILTYSYFLDHDDIDKEKEKIVFYFKRIRKGIKDDWFFESIEKVYTMYKTAKLTRTIYKSLAYINDSLGFEEASNESELILNIAKIQRKGELIANDNPSYEKISDFVSGQANSNKLEKIYSLNRMQNRYGGENSIYY